MPAYRVLAGVIGVALILYFGYQFFVTFGCDRFGCAGNLADGELSFVMMCLGIVLVLYLCLGLPFARPESIPDD